MKYCAYCNTEVKDDSDDCHACGSEITHHKVDKKAEEKKEEKPKRNKKKT